MKGSIAWINYLINPDIYAGRIVRNAQCPSRQKQLDRIRCHEQIDSRTVPLSKVNNVILFIKTANFVHVSLSLFKIASSNQRTVKIQVRL